MIIKDKKIELLAPAGDLPSLKTAVACGADSVYFGLKSLSMRARAKNFDISQLQNVMNFLHTNKKQGYLTLNTIIMDSELNKIKRVLQEAKESEVDAVICWDAAVISLAKSLNLPVHLSTQASVANFQAFKFYSNMGVERIVLARECTLEQIKNIKKQADKEQIRTKIECFIHGAMCVSISGRCFLSLDAMQKSANRGECLQPCRREFIIRDIDNEFEFILGKDYLLSPKDLCTIEFIDELIDSGIQVFKIEGRMRSKEYIKEVTSVYREAIDLHYEKELTDDYKNSARTRLSTVYNRGFSNGFYFGRPVDWISRRLEQRNEKIFIGEVVKFYKNISVAEIIIRSRELKIGDQLMITGDKTAAGFFQLKEIQQEHQWKDRVVKGEKAGIKVPFKVNRKDQIYIWTAKKR
jgi:putative protease